MTTAVRNPFRKDGNEPLGVIYCSQVTRWTTLSLCRIFTQDAPLFTNPFRRIINWNEVECLLERIQLPLPTVFLGIYYLNAFKQRCGNISGEFKQLYLIKHLLPLGLMIAMKYLDDSPYSTRYWASIMGLNLEAVKAMERRFLRIIDYDLFITKEQLEGWMKCSR
ncbi:hypothetical protein K493DRAFT_302180 [Basidiobolus meristosporus CBS 931.73]|uniref:Cyclin N-terminal domain-containing protein n=1 Tax=Basidiobolus meristosporus CBS 931.73 TaxID=1314790 RepID=A0A1Y1Y8P0_9FUNG|nr:hypothetical protein K493DRAFT_302180 [Basidiobolus meristosporus CBS 931.73]|eukprot:ORX94245.1 hypothetical protein K493DRAFT_302180 [Basidiobolus meristosporus CBS 931.73]